MPTAPSIISPTQSAHITISNPESRKQSLSGPNGAASVGTTSAPGPQLQQTSILLRHSGELVRGANAAKQDYVFCDPVCPLPPMDALSS